MDRNNLPKHIAIIPNGNRTWARSRGLPESKGHEKGYEVALHLARALRKIGIHTASFWAMSTENFALRSKNELKFLFKLVEVLLTKNAQEAHEDGARFIHVGRKENLPPNIRKLIDHWEEKTLKNKQHVINLLLDYGGHDEILRAFENIHEDLKKGNIKLSDLRKESGKYHNKYPYLKFKDYLDTKDQLYPFPDLIIRAANELRLSGFMPWQSVYAEFYTEDILFPDFDEKVLYRAIESYQKRNRKFGGNSS